VDSFPWEEMVKASTNLEPVGIGQRCQWTVSVLDPGEGVCADPVKRGAILEGEGPGPPSRNSEHQLSPDRGGGKT
jgi:hypothetical protein